MNKIESARIIAEFNGECIKVLCAECFNREVCTKLYEDGKDAESSHKLALAEAYIKRHEGKSRKKDHIRDAKKKDYVQGLKPVTRPNFRKALKEKITIKIKLHGDYWKELQEILKEEGVKVVNEYREKERVCLGIVKNVFNHVYGAIYLFDKYDEFDELSGIEYILETDTLVEDKVEEPRKQIKCMECEYFGKCKLKNSELSVLYVCDNYTKKVEKPTPLEIAKMIRDNGYKFDCKYDEDCRSCERDGVYYSFCKCKATVGDKNSDVYVDESMIDDYISANEPKLVKTVGIDNSDVTLAKPTVKENLSVPCEHLINGDSCGNPFDHCDKDCPANSEYPDPIRLDIPDIFYCPTPQGILRFKRSQIILKDTNNDDCLLKYHEEYPCYRTLEEAVIVAKKLWKGEGK
jgi:hypothetical protein